MKYYILLLGILFFVTGCSKENDLTPSPAGKNWFRLEDDSADRVQHAAYEVYTEWGIPVFCHDTIGSEERGTDHDGNIIVFHKVLDLNYNMNNPANLNSVTNKKRILIRDETDRLAGIKFVDEVFLPEVPDGFYIQSILLLDSLYEQEREGGEKKMLKMHQGMETLAVADIPLIADMSVEEQVERAGEIITYMTLNFLAKNPSDRLTDFKRVSYDPTTQRSFYEMSVRAPYYPGDLSCLEPAHWETYGFLDFDRSKYHYIDGSEIGSWYYTLGGEDADVEDFVMAAVSYRENDFKAEYADYPKVLEKFAIIREILGEIGFKLK